MDPSGPYFFKMAVECVDSEIVAKTSGLKQAAIKSSQTPTVVRLISLPEN